MTFTLTYAWWWIPALVTAVVAVWWIVPKDHGSNYPDVAGIFDVIIGLIILLFAWAIGGFFK